MELLDDELTRRGITRHAHHPTHQRLLGLDDGGVVGVTEHVGHRAPEEVDDRLVHPLRHRVLHGGLP